MLIRLIHNDRTVYTECFAHLNDALNLFRQIEDFFNMYFEGSKDHYTIQLIDSTNHVVFESTQHL